MQGKNYSRLILTLLVLFLILLVTALSLYLIYPELFKSIKLSPDNPPPLTSRTAFRKTGDSWLKKNDSWEKIDPGSLGDAKQLSDQFRWTVVAEIEEVNSSAKEIKAIFDKNPVCETSLDLLKPAKVCGIGTFTVSNVLIYSVARDFNVKDKVPYRLGDVSDLAKGDRINLLASTSAFFRLAGEAEVFGTQ